MEDAPVITHVYCMPGMSAKPEIFEYIDLPADRYEIHWLSWITPFKKEPIEAYSKRICAGVKHNNVVLIGVSLGGVVVQEMQKFIAVRSLVLVSTVKTKDEIPAYMNLARKTKLYKLLPTGWLKYLRYTKNWPLGKFIKGRLKIYLRYIDREDKRYLKWAIEQMLLWDREEVLPNIVQIHGDNDHIFPLKNIVDPVVVKGGTHLMIINRFRWFNEHLPALISKAEAQAD